MKIKILSLVLILLFICTIGQTAFAVEMYAPDGRTVNVAETDVAAWKSVGWYDYPVTTVYAMDGRSAVIATTAVNDWVNVGWRTTNYVTMYAADGRTANVSLWDVDAWKNVGWYEYPVTIMYAFDGRTAVVALADVTVWQNVGWFASKEDVYRHVAKMVIENYYDDPYYRQPEFHCLDMGSYYLLIHWPTQNGFEEVWHKVYKDGTVEYIISGGTILQDFDFRDYIYENFDLPIYQYYNYN